MSPQTYHGDHDENSGSKIYWVPILSESSAQSHRASPGLFAFMSEVIGFKHTPCPPWCHAPAPIGRGFLMATPAYTFLILLAASFIFSPAAAIPWMKIIVGSLLAIPAGFGVGYLYYLGSHSAIEHFDLALSREKLQEEIKKRG